MKGQQSGNAALVFPEVLWLSAFSVESRRPAAPADATGGAPCPVGAYPLRYPGHYASSMARVSETNQQNNRRNSAPSYGRQPRIAMLIRSNGTWREVAFERRSLPAAPRIAAGLAISASQEQ